MSSHIVTHFVCVMRSFKIYSALLCCAQSLGRVQLFATPWAAVLQDPSLHGILQARILEWVAMPSSRGNARPRNGTEVSCIVGVFFTSRATWEAQDLPIAAFNYTIWHYKLQSPCCALHFRDLFITTGSLCLLTTLYFLATPHHLPLETTNLLSLSKGFFKTPQGIVEPDLRNTVLVLKPGQNQ